MRNSCILYLLRIIRKKKKLFAVVNFAPPSLLCSAEILPAHSTLRLKKCNLGNMTLNTQTVAGRTISLCLRLLVVLRHL